MAQGTSIIDGTWQLPILVTDLNVLRYVNVRGDLHIGGLMLQLVSECVTERDWSDHALWWPEKRRWLQHFRSTLDQNGITAESQLEFTPIHKDVRIRLPDGQMVEARIDFFVNSFKATKKLCQDLGIRYSEELSLKRYIPQDDEKAAINRGWLDSSRSLMEQGILEGDIVQLRFKFMNFFDSNPKYDPVKFNQLYQQAKWSILLDENDHTEEEATLLAALQLQATLQKDSPEPEGNSKEQARIDFSVNSVKATKKKLCRDLGIRYSEELSRYSEQLSKLRLEEDATIARRNAVPTTGNIGGPWLIKFGEARQ